MERKPCWEVLACGLYEQCPAYPKNGRNCFAVTATKCKGEIQGSYEEKIDKCRGNCVFFKDMMNGAA